MARARASLEWDQTTEVLFLLWNRYRDHEQHKKPYERHEFHPYRTADDYSQPAAEPDMAAIAQIKRQYKVTRLSNGRKVNRSRESFSPAAH